MKPTLLAALLGGCVLYVAPAAGETIDVAIFHTERDTFAQPYKWWAEEVAKRTGNRVQFKAHYSSALVPLTETFNAVRNGAVPAGVIAPSVLTGQIPALAYIEMIGGMPGDPDAAAKATLALQSHIEGLFRQHGGVEYLWMAPSAGAGAACSGRHLKQASDWKGLKIRAAGRWQSTHMLQLGASPTSIDPSEVYLALQTKTVDCSLINNNLVLSLKLHEVAPKLTQFDMPLNAVGYIMNKDVWARISDADRKAIKEASREAVIHGTKLIYDAQEEAGRKIKELGGDVYRLNKEEQAAFRKATIPVFEKIGETSGAAGKPFRDVLSPYW